MSLTVNSRLQTSYIMRETTWGTAVTPTNGSRNLMVSLQLSPTAPLIPRPDKTGSLGEILGIPGRRAGTWSTQFSAAGSGAAGTAPDSAALIEMVFGKAVALVGGVSATFALDDLSPSCSIYNYNAPSTATQQVGIGSIGNKFKASIGADMPLIDISGESLWIYDTEQAADGATDTVAKGGLGSFPAEPSTPTTNGTPPQGFKGVITLDGNAYTTLLTADINLDVARELPKDAFNSSYPAGPVAGLRTIGCNFTIYDDDSANLISLKKKAMAPTNPKPTSTLVFQLGTIAGNIWTYTLRNTILNPYTLDYSRTRRALQFTGKSFDTTIGAKDAITLACT